MYQKFLLFYLFAACFCHECSCYGDKQQNCEVGDVGITMASEEKENEDAFVGVLFVLLGIQVFEEAGFTDNKGSIRLLPSQEVQT